MLIARNAGSHEGNARAWQSARSKVVGAFSMERNTSPKRRPKGPGHWRPKTARLAGEWCLQPPSIMLNPGSIQAQGLSPYSRFGPTLGLTGSLSASSRRTACGPGTLAYISRTQR